MNKEIIKLRHELHKHTELSNCEIDTSKKIEIFISKLNPDEIIRFEGLTAIAFVFNSKKQGKTLMFRAELDALPIKESLNLEYCSEKEEVAHSCGHDGHMAIISGLAQKISQNRPETGKVILLFQNAEEAEQGAKDVVDSPEFQTIKPDYIFALHNIPGVEKNTIVLKKGNFTVGSFALTVKLYGKTSHAAEPEKGISPANAVSEIIRKLHQLIENKEQFKDFTSLTIVHVLLGEIAFGTSPGYAEIRVTLRAFENKDLTLLKNELEKIIINIAEQEKLKPEISYSEIFPITVNHEECFSLIKKSAEQNNLEIKYIEKPFKWGEDFGYYTEKYKGGFFGLGSGINQPALHNPDYDFPDDIIETGVNVFYNIYTNVY